MIYQDEALKLFYTYEKKRVLYTSSGYFIANNGDNLGQQVEMLLTPHAKYGYRSRYIYVDQYNDQDEWIARYNLTFYGAKLDENFIRALK